MMDYLAAPVAQPALPVKGKVPLTEVREPKGAIETSTTGSQEANHNVISGPHKTHVVAQFFNRPSGFMAGDDRDIRRPFAVERVQVTVADGGGRQPDFHLPLLGWINLQIFDR
jgi:hypothetical protein